MFLVEVHEPALATGSLREAGNRRLRHLVAEPYQLAAPVPQFVERRRWRSELRVQPDRLLVG